MKKSNSGGRAIGVAVAFKNHKLIGVLLVATSLGWLTYYFNMLSQKILVQHITGDLRFSNGLSNSIKALLATNLNQKSSERFNLVKKNFPMVDRLSVRMTGLNKIHVKFSAADLVYRLGHNFVLTASGEVFLASCFLNSALKDLPTIVMHNNVELTTDISPQQINFLLTLPENLLAEYQINWYSENQAVLIHQNKKFQITLRANQQLTPKTLEICQQLLTTYPQHAGKKCGNTIKIDLRFDKQIIVVC